MACQVNGTSGESVSASISWFRDSDRTWDWGKGYKHHDNQTWLFMQVYIYCDVRQRKKEFLQTDISKSLNLNQIKKKKKKKRIYLTVLMILHVNFLHHSILLTWPVNNPSRPGLPRVWISHLHTPRRYPPFGACFNGHFDETWKENVKKRYWDEEKEKQCRFYVKH